MRVTPLIAAKSLKMASMFLKEEKICYKTVYFILCLGSVNCQKPRWKVRISRQKTDFLKGAWYLKYYRWFFYLDDELKIWT